MVTKFYRRKELNWGGECAINLLAFLQQTFLLNCYIAAVSLAFLGNQSTARTFGRMLGMCYSDISRTFGYVVGGSHLVACLKLASWWKERDTKAHDIVWEFFRLAFCQSVPFLYLQNVADIKKLKSVGICTIKGIQMTTRRALCNVKGLSEAKVDKIKEAANKLIVSKIPSLLV